MSVSGISYAILMALALFIGAITYYLPYNRDDFLFAFIWDTPVRLQTFADLIPSLQRYYLTWGGREVPVFFHQFFILAGKGYFAFVNGLMYTALMVLIYWHALGRVTRNFNPWLLCLIITGGWFALPDYGFTCIWACGTAHYLWPAVLILATLLPVHLYFAQREAFPAQVSPFMVLGYALLAFFASLTMENSVVTMCLGLLILSYYAHRQGNLPNWLKAGTVSSMIGGAILILAPGNFARASTTDMAWYEHIENFFGAHVQILLGMLPVLLLAAIALKLLLRPEKSPEGFARPGWGHMLAMALIVPLLYSQLNGHVLAEALTNGILDYILYPLDLVQENTAGHLAYALSSTEQLLIYIIACCMLYSLAKKVFHLQGISACRELRQRFKSYSGETRLFYQRFLFIAFLACTHNLVMLLSPQFPARSGYGSAVYLLILMAMLMMRAEVYETLMRPHRKVWAVILFLAFVPMAVETFSGCRTLYYENQARETYIYEQVAAGNTTLTLKKFSVGTSVLRHVYISDFDSSFARGCAMPYYGLKDVIMVP